jgi:hypothetical protein
MYDIFELREIAIAVGPQRTEFAVGAVIECQAAIGAANIGNESIGEGI